MTELSKRTVDHLDICFGRQVYRSATDGKMYLNILNTICGTPTEILVECC